jgi:hypothetical protein
MKSKEEAKNCSDEVKRWKSATFLLEIFYCCRFYLMPFGNDIYEILKNLI